MHKLGLRFENRILRVSAPGALRPAIGARAAPLQFTTMPKFLQFIFASCLGSLLAIGVITLIGTCAIGGALASADQKPEVKANSVLRLSAPAVLPEKTGNIAVDPFAFNTDPATGLQDMRRALKHAKDDDDIKGIFIDVQNFGGGFASLASLRESLVDFKESGKFIVSYADLYSQGAYGLASTADVVMVNPVGAVDLSGFAANLPFMKDFLDNIGVKMEIFYVGKYKSATEPFRRSEMSEENREQIRAYLGEIWNEYLADVAASRGKTVADLQRIADELLVRRGEDAVTYGLADQVGYRADAYAVLRDRLGLDEDEDINSINLAAYADATRDLGSGKNRIAVVYAEGDIVDGKTGLGTVGSADYGRILRKIKDDDKVKAVVLRVNSPGGSALASENILHEVKRLQTTGRPVVVSMGDLAASGGYYISASADRIFAEPNTLTGSIGIFGMLPNVTELTREKLGVNFDSVKTARYANLGQPFYEITQPERDIIQGQLETGYEIFLDRVAEGRGMTRDEVNEVAQGRVWTGTQAQSRGLVDEIGGLDEALAYAAAQVDLEVDEIKIREYPTTKEPMQQLIEELTGQEQDGEGPVARVREAVIREEIGADLYPYYKHLRDVSRMRGPQARLPFVLEFE